MNAGFDNAVGRGQCGIARTSVSTDAFDGGAYRGVGIGNVILVHNFACLSGDLSGVRSGNQRIADIGINDTLVIILACTQVFAVGIRDGQGGFVTVCFLFIGDILSGYG